MRCTPVLPGWVLRVWGYRGGHSHWWGAPQHTTGKTFSWGGLLGYNFPLGYTSNECGKLYRVKTTQARVVSWLLLNSFGVTPMSPGCSQVFWGSPLCTPTRAVMNCPTIMVNDQNLPMDQWWFFLRSKYCISLDSYAVKPKSCYRVLFHI